MSGKYKIALWLLKNDRVPTLVSAIFTIDSIQTHAFKVIINQYGSKSSEKNGKTILNLSRKRSTPSAD